MFKKVILNFMEMLSFNKRRKSYPNMANKDYIYAVDNLGYDLAGNPFIVCEMSNCIICNQFKMKGPGSYACGNKDCNSYNLVFSDYLSANMDEQIEAENRILSKICKEEYAEL